MSHLAPSTSSLQSTERIGQGSIRDEFKWQSPYTASIHILDNDSLLNIFDLYRPAIFYGDEDDVVHKLGGELWSRERWWYKLAHVCQRWRNLILESTSYLRLCLFCTHGTPVADMLAHSPPLPLVIDYIQMDTDLDITAEEVEGIILALGQHTRVRRVRLLMPSPNLRKLIMALVGEYTALEYLIMMYSTTSANVTSTALLFPETLQTPRLRHLLLKGFAFPIGSLFFITAVGIVTFNLFIGNQSAYIEPNTLLQWISSMPQLETLRITFLFAVHNDDVEMQLIHSPITTHVTIPNLRRFEFQGASAYLEAVVHRLTTPQLKKLHIQFFLQSTLSVPRLLPFMDTAENLRFDSIKIEFSESSVSVWMYPHEKVEIPVLMNVFCWYLNLQVRCLAQIFDSLSQGLSTVEHLTLEYEEPSEEQEHNEPEIDRAVHAEWSRTEWRNLLRSFSNVKALHVNDKLVKELSNCLQVDDEEPSLELLPELQKLTYSGSSDTEDAFTSFIDDRQKTGHSVTLVQVCGPALSDSHSSSQGFSESSFIIASGSSKARSDPDT